MSADKLTGKHKAYCDAYKKILGCANDSTGDEAMTKPRTAAGNGNEIARAHVLAVQMLGELEAVCRHGDALGDIMTNFAGLDNPEERINDAWKQVTSLPTRIDAMHKLATTLQILAALDASTNGGQ
jgi:hypothetical protein